MLEQAATRQDLSKAKRIKLVIHAFAEHQCQLMIGELGETFNKPDHLIADLTLVTPDGNLTSALVKTGQPIVDTYSFDFERRAGFILEISSFCWSRCIKGMRK